jgi:hypothetical protein
VHPNENTARSLFAGHEATKNLITNAVHVLHRHPEELAKLRADPAVKLFSELW